VTVYGRVRRTNKSSSGHQFLNFDNTDLTVICRKSDISNFKNGAPAETFRDKDVEITGRLERYRDKLQIRLVKPDQIRIVRPEGLATISGVELKEVRKNGWLSPAGLVL
jgi:DNA/RNA endonuclease YhcR with UshA esterase domain